MTQNWRIEKNAEDYLGHQKKQLQVADRRPVIRRASDLVGPGIAQSAVRITDFNDILALFNGFFSATEDAVNAPPAGGPWVGTVVSDVELGGVQAFYGMEDAKLYRRVFTRNPADENSISWGLWTSVTFA